MFIQNTPWIRTTYKVYDAKHHNSTSIANVPEASKEEFAVDGKHKMKAIALKNDSS